MAQKVFVKTVKGSVGLSLGIGLGSAFAMGMEDTIYNKLRRNIIMPMQMVAIKQHRGEQLSKDDMSGISDGTLAFLKEIKPHALIPSNEAKKLVVDDNVYSTPADHYFSYVQ